MKHLAALGLLAGLALNGDLSAQEKAPSTVAVEGASPIAAQRATVYEAWPFDANEAARRQQETAGALGVPRELKLDLDGNVSMRLVLIPAGKFKMGSSSSEKDRVMSQAAATKSQGAIQRAAEILTAEPNLIEVTISKPFYMSVTDVTRGQFAAFVAATGHVTDAEKAASASGVEGPSWRKVGYPQTDAHPVVRASYNDAVEFCRWLGRKAGRKLKLPTEARWEYACRAGAATAYQWGDDPADGNGWCNAADLDSEKELPNWDVFPWHDGYVYSSPAGRYRPNAFGLYDMHGNVWQWCADWYAEELPAGKKLVDPLGPAYGSSHVTRGGGFYSTPWFPRSATRVGASAGAYPRDIGFRVICIELLPQPVDEKAVAALIRLLADDSFAVREKATQDLDEMGEAAHPLLEAKVLEKGLDVEAAQRIRNILRQGHTESEKPKRIPTIPPASSW
jgi:formylglycine-generating enzyme